MSGAVLTVAGLTLREASRRRVLWALGALTLVLLGLSAWGFAKLASVEIGGAGLTSGEARLAASEVQITQRPSGLTAMPSGSAPTGVRRTMRSSPTSRALTSPSSSLAT